MFDDEDAARNALFCDRDPNFKSQGMQHLSVPSIRSLELPNMPIPITDIPPEILQKIALYSTLGSNLGPPTDLYNCLLTCRAFRDVLSPKNARELYFLIFVKRFDARGPIYRLGPSVVRENAALEMRRRFSAIQIFKRRLLDHPELTEAFWVAYLMVEDADTSQTNVKQLLRVGLPSFLDLYLRRRLYDGAADNGDWPTLTVENSLAIALSWTLASQSLMSYEEPGDCKEMMRLLRRIAFPSFRYSISNIPEDQFDFGPSFVPPTPITRDSPSYPIPVPPPQEINYIGLVRRKAHVPSPVLFASLLFLARQDRLTPPKIPSHVIYETREEATQAGHTDLTMADVQHFLYHCRTHFADFPGISVGIQSSAMATSPNATLCEPSSYKLGALSGSWQGSLTFAESELIESWMSGDQFDDEKHFGAGVRKPIYLTLEEHYCYNANSVVPRDLSENGVRNAWLPHDLQAIETPHGMKFSGSDAFHTTYETFRPGQNPLPESKQVMDIIITGKTDDLFAAWGQPNKVLGRVRMCDGLVALARARPDPENIQREMLRGYLTSSKNFVGKVSVNSRTLMGIFNLNKNHTATSRSSYKSSM